MVLVTGGSGLLGKELITQLLASGKDVIAIYHNTPLADFNSSRLKQYECDILDIVRIEEIMQEVDEVYHCAGMVTFDPRHTQELFKVNIEGTANIVNAAINSGIRKLIHTSSIAALGQSEKDERINETMYWSEQRSNSVYGKSKYLGEMEVWRGIGEGLIAVIVNPVVILGAGDWNSGSSQLFKSVYNGFPWYSDGSTGFVDVRDVAAAMIQLMESDITAQRFIISAANCSYQHLFTLIAHGFKIKAPYKKVTPLMARLVWRIEAIKSFFTTKKPLITKETTATALAKIKFDNSKLHKYLPGFTYRSLEETVTDTCTAFLQKINNNK